MSLGIFSEASDKSASKNEYHDIPRGKGGRLWKKVIECEMFVYFLYNFWIERDTIKKSIGLHVKYPSFLSDCNETWGFHDRFSKNTQISNFIKIRPIGAELLYANLATDGQAGRQKHDATNSRFLKFCERV